MAGVDPKRPKRKRRRGKGQSINKTTYQGIRGSVGYGHLEPGDQTRLTHSFALFAAVVVPSLVYFIILVLGYDGGHYLLRGDCPYYYVTALSIAQDGDLDLSNQLRGNVENHATQVSLSVDGRIVPKHPILMPLVSLPLVVLLGPLGALGFNVMQLMALLVILYRLAARWASPWTAAASVIMTGIGSVMPHYAWNYSPDIFATLVLAGAIVALPAASDQISPGRHLLAGLLLGLSCVSKFSLALFFPLAIVSCTRPYRRSVPWLFLGAALPLVLLAVLNAHLFGSPLVTSYDRIARVEGGRLVLFSQREDFGLSLVQGIWRQITDSRHGLLLTSPVTIPSLIGLAILWRRSATYAAGLGLSSLALFLFFSSYRLWNESHYGNRFLMPIIALAAIPLASLLEWGALRAGHVVSSAAKKLSRALRGA
jgi:hypothetical protein